MNVAAEVEDRRETEAWERRGLEIELNSWGRWIESHYHYQGYPGMDSIAAVLEGRGIGNYGHRILCLDMPIAVYAVHGRIIRLTERYQEALYLRYAVRVKEGGEAGTFWTESEICLKTGIKLDSFRRRLRRAKAKLLGIDIDPIDKEDIA